MVKIQPKPVNGSALFQETVGALVTPVSHQELADALDCSVPLLRASLRDPTVTSFRNPPGGWEVTVRRMLEAKAAHFADLAKRLTLPNR
jgi:hypothetical protein